jgi:hypothetical protein
MQRSGTDLITSSVEHIRQKANTNSALSVQELSCIIRSVYAILHVLSSIGPYDIA